MGRYGPQYIHPNSEPAKMAKEAKTKAALETNNALVHVPVELAPKQHRMEKWPNIGRIVWTNPEEGRYGRYHEREREEPRPWIVVSETLATIDLKDARLPKKGEVFASMHRIRKDDEAEVKLLYGSLQEAWAARLQYAKKEVDAALHWVKEAAKDTRKARARHTRAVKEMAKTIKRSKAKAK